MDTQLAKLLVQRGVIRQGTVLEAYQSARGLSCLCDSFALGRYVVMGASVAGGYVYFDVGTNTDRQRIRSDYVMSVDGMAIKRVAAAHQLREDGSVLPLSRRGQCEDITLSDGA